MEPIAIPSIFHQKVALSSFQRTETSQYSQRSHYRRIAQKSFYTDKISARLLLRYLYNVKIQGDASFKNIDELGMGLNVLFKSHGPNKVIELKVC